MSRARILADYVAGGTTAAEFDYLDGVTSNVQTQLDRLPDQGQPHIIPDVLYPAWSGLLDNHTGYTFTDSSASAHTITSVGDPHHSGAQEKVGSTSLKFEDNDTISIANHADWDFGTGSGTIEMWFYPTKTGGQRLISSQSGSNYFIVWFGASARKIRINTQLGAEQDSSTDLALNQWHHVAIVKDGTSTTKIFTNGVETLDATNHNGDWPDSTEPLHIGSTSTQTEGFNGFIDEIRITKGLAVYTGTFTPQTTALTTTWSSGTGIAANSTASNVKLLLHSDAGGNVGAYGTEQADGTKYYYTDIKGSKPIKDPRIGAHFGSQRHRISSRQLLEQETATHGKDVYSLDGREWARFVGKNSTMSNNSSGVYITMTNDGSANSEFIEVVGYFSSVNILDSLFESGSERNRWKIDLNGTNVASVTDSSNPVSADTPLGYRYTGNASVRHFAIDAT